MIVAMLVDTRKPMRSEVRTTGPRDPCPCQNHSVTATMSPHATPSSKPIGTSRKNTFHTSVNSTRPVANPRMIKVDD